MPIGVGHSGRSRIENKYNSRPSYLYIAGPTDRHKHDIENSV